MYIDMQSEFSSKVKLQLDRKGLSLGKKKKRLEKGEVGIILTQQYSETLNTKWSISGDEEVKKKSTAQPSG